MSLFFSKEVVAPEYSIELFNYEHNLCLKIMVILLIQFTYMFNNEYLGQF